jgi:alkylation response protein AidB-like acyl-CoA dehydrogenase
MDFQFTDDQIAIRDLAHQIFADRATDEFLLDFDRTDATYDDQIWNTLAEQGLLGICVPEEFGGTGLTFVELCCILEELGRTVAPTPAFSSLVFGGLVINQFGSTDQKQQWLSKLAAGEAKLTAAVGDFGATSAYQHQVSDANGVLNGVKTAVLDGAVADLVIVAAGDSVFLVDTKAEGVSVEAQASYKGENFATLTLKNVNAELLGKLGQGDEIMGWLEQYSDVPCVPCKLVAAMNH